MKRFVLLAMLFLAGPLAAQDAVPLTLKGDVVVVKIDKVVVVKEDRTIVRSLPFTVTAPKADDYRWTFPSNVTAIEESDGATLKVMSAPKGEITISVRTMVIDYNAKITTRKSGSLTFNIGDVAPVPPPPPPKPPEPDPAPKPPTPQPVLSFRVILVYESGDTLTGPQNSIIYGKTVEDFLTATCTGGKAGWRRRDKDAGGDGDPAMSAVWSAIQKEFAPPRNTKTPAVAVQVNERIEIIPLAATPAEMVAVLKKYAEGK